MSQEEVRHEELQKKSRRLLRGTLKHVRAAALASLLVPLGTVAVSPLSAQNLECGGYGQPPCDVPEPNSMLLLGTGLAGLMLAKRGRK